MAVLYDVVHKRFEVPLGGWFTPNRVYRVVYEAQQVVVQEAPPIPQVSQKAQGDDDDDAEDKPAASSKQIFHSCISNVVKMF